MSGRIIDKTTPGGVIVISTGLAAKMKGECIDSVRAQKGVRLLAHDYVEASTQKPFPRAATENLWHAVVTSSLRFDPSTIVALVDGDDWLAGGYALARVVDVYAQHPDTLVTYGSYRFADGRPGHAAPYDPSENIRAAPWRATHLKTFRLGMWRHMRPGYFMSDDGRWLDRCVDLATMFPLIERAGWSRTRFVPDELYVYNFRDSWEHNAPAGDRVSERRVEAMLRARTPLACVEAL